MIIGSYAIKHHFPDFVRDPKDMDIVEGTLNTLPDSDVKVEFLKNPILIEWYGKKYPYIIGKDELYTLKVSHSFWELENGSWEKHMWDIQFMKEKGCRLILHLFYKLYNYWNKVHSNNKRSNLKMNSEEFFDNAITFPVGHDDLHEILIKHSYFNQDKPTYTKILKDGAEIEVNEDKFNLLTEKEKLYYRSAFAKMLKKFIISHAPIWEAIWIIENHKKLVTTIPFNFIEFFNKNIKYEEINS